jgi:hypothetical protein
MGAVVSLITLLLPVVIKLIDFIITKKSDNENLKRDFLKLVDSLDKEVPVNLRKGFQDQLEVLKKELEIEDLHKGVIATERANYKEAYERLLVENEELKAINIKT